MTKRTRVVIALISLALAIPALGWLSLRGSETAPAPVTFEGVCSDTPGTAYCNESGCVLLPPCMNRP